MKIRKDDADTVISSAWAHAAGCKHSGRERSLGITAS